MDRKHSQTEEGEEVPFSPQAHESTTNHCKFTADSLPIHCLFIVYPLPVSSPSTACSPPVHLPSRCLFTAYSPLDYMFTLFADDSLTIGREQAVGDLTGYRQWTGSEEAVKRQYIGSA
jgi:hypothetical protein